MRQLCMTIARAALEECIGQAASSLAARPGQARLGYARDQAGVEPG